VTKLRDNGFLETDDPVVAACFLGQNARFIFFDTKEISQGLYGVLTIRSDGWNNHDYPILIPASVVAEAVNLNGPISPPTFAAKVVEFATRVGLPELYPWLRKHTKATP